MVFRPPALRSRGKITYRWIPADTEHLLDGGCASGYYTEHYAKKAKKTIGIDPIPFFIENAKKRKAKGLSFRACSLEKTPFKKGQFDVVVLNDVIEHVMDERAALKEMDRVLKKGGSMIITVPHKGLFGFMDTDNYVYLIKRHLPIIYKLAYYMKKKQWPKKVEFRQGYDTEHKHYRLKDVLKLLPKGYEVEKVHRGGFFLNPLVANLQLLISTVLGDRIYRKVFDGPLYLFSEAEYRIPFGPLSYHMGIRVRKTRK